MRGGVEGLAGVEGEDVVGPSPLEPPLRHEQGRAGVGAGEGHLLPVADHSVSCEHFRDALGEGAREQLHVQLAQGYGSVVVQSGRARYLGAEPYGRVPPVHRWRGAAKDGAVGVDQEPLDGCREGVDETGLHVVGTRGLAIGLVQGGLQVLHGVLLDLGPGPFRDPGPVAAEDRLEAGEVHRAFVIQFPPEGANRDHHVVGLCEERLGVGDPHVREARRARGLYLYGPPHGFRPLGDVLGVAAPEIFDGALAVSLAAATQAHPEPRPHHGTPDRPAADPVHTPPDGPPTQAHTATPTDTTAARLSGTVHPHTPGPTEGLTPQAPATSGTGDLPAMTCDGPAPQRRHVPPAGPPARPAEPSSPVCPAPGPSPGPDPARTTAPAGAPQPAGPGSRPEPPPVAEGHTRGALQPTNDEAEMPAPPT